MYILRRLGSWLLLVLAGVGSSLHAQSYDNLWKQVEQAEKKSLPETVVKLTGQIYRKGLQERNAPQMLKAYVCRSAYQEKLTPDSLYARLPQLEQWAQTEPDAVNRAILHSLLAEEYAGYASRHYSTLRSRTDVEGDDLSADIRLWTSAQFIRKVDACCTEALRDGFARFGCLARCVGRGVRAVRGAGNGQPLLWPRPLPPAGPPCYGSLRDDAAF